ncbi:alpha/beta hydrolase [Acinetobacter sp. WU_MDCI_Axc73]|nr:alpha/beta hydrolase [Acinetobacter sp. WU_MDCI_Axc73]
MNILFIHGMNQQHYTAQSLRQRWLNIFKQGLSLTHLPYNAETTHLSFPFYGDLLTQSHLSNALDLEAFLPKAFMHLHFPLHLYKTPQSGQEHKAYSIAPLPTQEASLRSRLYEEAFLIKDKTLREFMILLDHFPKLNESLIHEFLVEMYCYLSNTKFMQDVHLRILKKIKKDEELIVIGHSLGSVIAYNLLQQIQYPVKIKRFITLASPLAFRIIQEKITHPISRPKNLQGDWFNFYSKDDFLSAFPLRATPFNFTPPIINQEISTTVDHPHEIAGYLRHPDVLKRILEMTIPNQ